VIMIMMSEISNRDILVNLAHTAENFRFSSWQRMSLPTEWLKRCQVICFAVVQKGRHTIVVSYYLLSSVSFVVFLPIKFHLSVSSVKILIAKNRKAKGNDAPPPCCCFRSTKLLLRISPRCAPFVFILQPEVMAVVLLKFH